MKKIILTIFAFLMTFCSLKAQPAWQPDVNFSSGKNVCDTASYKLVLYDDFNGDTLSNLWLPYITWDGKDDDDWNNSHGSDPNELIKESNVVVSNGICHLYAKNEHFSWHCATCSMQTRTTNITNSIIVTPYHLTDGSDSPNYFNSGKFVARIKFPIFEHAHSTFWTWYGDSAGVDEIDMEEAYGGKTHNLILPIDMGRIPHVDHVLHAWVPNPPNPDYDFHQIDDRYPYQSYQYILDSNGLDISNWNTYGCEWDTAVIKFYLNYNWVSTIWKYRQERTRTLIGGLFHFFDWHYYVGSGCNPSPGTWSVTPGFPYNDSSQSQLRLSCSVDDIYGNPDTTYTLGEMDVDYVAVYQRHPEQDGHKNICAVAQKPVVTGPTDVCGTATYIATPAMPGGYWFVAPQSGITITDSGVNGGSAYVNISNAPTSWQNAYTGVSYYYPSSHEGCPLNYSGHMIRCLSIPGHQFMVVIHTLSYNSANFQLAIPKPWLEPDSQTEFEWDISYVAGSNRDTQSIHTFGRYVSTPAYVQTDSSNYYLHWNVKMLGPDSQTVSSWQGTRTNMDGYGKQSRDTSLYFLDALITDSAAYVEDVQSRLEGMEFPIDVDSGTVDKYIEKDMADALEPYLIDPGQGQKPMAQTFDGNKQNTGGIIETKIYPNPLSNVLFIIPGNNFRNNSTVYAMIYDLTGRLRGSIKKHYLAGKILKIPLFGLNNGIYVLELRQDEYTEHFEIIKKEN